MSMWIWHNDFGYDGGGGLSEYYFTSLEEAKHDFFNDRSDQKAWRPSEWKAETCFERGSQYGGEWVYFAELKAKK